MVSVSLIWIYMIITCYVTGYTVLKILALKRGYRIRRESSYLYAGIVAVTVYAQFFSIFYKVGVLANLILLMICGICVCVFFRDFSEKLHTMRLTITPVKAGVVLLLFLLFAYGTSTGIIHYDTGLYHAQSIRWIEEYGVIKGLGNLHSRLAYNSAAFCLSALYSFSFLSGQSFHCCAGFLAFLLALTCGEAFSKNREKKLKLSDFARVLGLYYLLIIFDEMISPASDYFMVLCVFYIVIRWLDLLEEGEKSYVPYGLLCIMGVCVVTFKLSGALILLLTLKPAVQMIREKRGKEILLYMGAGVLTLLPFLIRNVILSGWLLYPFTFVDLFDVPFKIPKGMADYDSKEIQVFGRGYSDVTRYEEPITAWFKDWAAALDPVNLVFLILAFLGFLLLAGFAVYGIKKRKKEMAEYLLVMGTMGICFLFWLTSAPLIRYGCVYLWLFPGLTWGFLYLKVTPYLDRYKIGMILLFLFGIYKAGNFVVETVRSDTTEYLVLQKDYENFETVPYELHGYTFYYPREGDRTGYADFPASPLKAEDIFLGDTIEDGFKDVIHSDS